MLELKNQPQEIESTGEQLRTIQLSLVRAMTTVAEVKPLASPIELLQMAKSISKDLEDLKRQTAFLIHVTKFERDGFEAEVEEIAKRVSSGEFKAEGIPLEDVLAEARSRFEKRSLKS